VPAAAAAARVGQGQWMCRWTGIAEGGVGRSPIRLVVRRRRPTDRCWYRRVLLPLLVVASFMQLNGAAGLGSPKARRWRLSGAIFQITNCNCFFKKIVLMTNARVGRAQLVLAFLAPWWRCWCVGVGLRFPGGAAAGR
jgi:hypothetical protein